jgi:hypothetical protein
MKKQQIQKQSSFMNTNHGPQSTTQAEAFPHLFAPSREI